MEAFHLELYQALEIRLNWAWSKVWALLQLHNAGII